MFPALYAIVDGELYPDADSCQAFACNLADAGVTLIQYRHKTASSRALFETGRSLSALLSAKGARLIINDRPDIAAIGGAGGVHVGQEDLGVEQARAICRPPMWVGVSTHNLTQLKEADATSADYVAIGPIFATATKKNPDPVVGVEFVKQARKLTRKPLVAIGGITIENAADVWRAGADSLAVVRGLLGPEPPAQRARKFLELSEQVQRNRDRQ